MKNLQDIFLPFNRMRRRNHKISTQCLLGSYEVSPSLRIGNFAQATYRSTKVYANKPTKR